MPSAVTTKSCLSAPCSAPSSPKHRLKFLCSHGGKILPRPGDGHLKYVGGETRVISLPRDIHFQEVMKRLTYLIDGAMILKYQLVSDDLDALVSVKSDEDLVHMFDEIEHYETSGSPRMRAFLFPPNNFSTEPLPPDQRYIYSVNGINTNQSSSPRSADGCTCKAAPDPEPPFHNNMHKTHPEPPVHNNMHNTQSEPPVLNNMHKTHPEPPVHNNMHKTQSSQQIRSQYGQLHPQYYHTSGRNGAAPQRLVSVRSVGRSERLTAPPLSYYNPREIQPTRCMYIDASNSHFSDGRISIERQATLP